MIGKMIKRIIRKSKERKILKKVKKMFSAFDLLDAMVYFNFEAFKLFYEDGDMEIIDWDADMPHKEAKAKMDALYKYWTVLRPYWEAKTERILASIDEKWKVEMKLVPLPKEEQTPVDLPNGKKTYLASRAVFDGVRPEKARELKFSLMTFIDRLDQKKLEELISLREWMWT